MQKNKQRRRLRRRRHYHVRRRLSGTPERPRLCVFRSNKHMYAQVIDDTSGHTLVSGCTLSPELREDLSNGGNVDASVRLGDMIGRKCLEKGITQVVFDRGGYIYRGRVRALADAARKRFSEAGALGF